MNRLGWKILSCVGLILLSGCPKPVAPPASGDATPPAYTLVEAQFEAATPPNPRGQWDITKSDATRFGMGANLTLRLIAIASDAESGIATITIESELKWRCSMPASPIVTISQTQKAVLNFQSLNQPNKPLDIWRIDATADPLNQAVCSGAFSAGPTDVHGFVRAVATNGVGSQTKSRTFIFYQGQGISTDTAYMAECRRKGVPIPPDWSESSTEWILRGNLAGGRNLLFPGQDAFVWTYTDGANRGGCVALPRAGGGTRGGLAGIICQSATTGHACFWDNRRRDPNNPMAQVPPIDWKKETLRINELKDASNLTEPDSGTCPVCHRGDNAFLIAPDDPTWAQVLKLGASGTFTTRVEASTDTQGGRPRYVPITSAIPGQQRAGWGNVFAPGGCASSCHEQHPSAGTQFNVPQPMPPSCAAGGTQENCYK